MYQVIARKYRPQTLTDVVSQEHVKRTLANAVDTGRVGHGYIFSGPRGTGKTTMARILAMALNAEDGPRSDFDPEDPVCKEIAAGSAMDVIEIDAASNRRIDDIRELRESVRYRPARDRYKVFIIDEAHQITTDAFNALLKTLEEPPEWVVFILCTTEPQAVPATILSRCQSFQFRTVDLEEVIGRMRWICDQEGIEADDDALTAIALAGDGSIRDSLSTLDQAIASCGKHLKADDVRDLLGAIPSEITDRIVDALAAGDAPGMLEIVDRLFREGRHPQHFVGQLTRYLRNLMVMKVAGADTRLVTAGAGERKRASESLDRFSAEDLTRYVQLLVSLYRDLQNASQPRFHLELGLLKLVYAGKLRPIEQALANLGGAGPAAPPAPPPKAAPRSTPAPGGARASEPEPEPDSLDAFLAEVGSAPDPPPPPRQETKPPAPRLASPAEGDLATRAAAALDAAGNDFIAGALRQAEIDDQGEQLVVRATPEDRTTLEFDWRAVETALRDAAGRTVRVTLGGALTEAAPRRADEPQPAAEAGQADETTQRALDDPGVEAFRKLFPGQVREVRDLREFS